METWRARIDLSHPVWADSREHLHSLGETTFPTPAKLSSCLPPGLSSNGGSLVRFVPAVNLPGVDYEKHIFGTGEVSTREANWHDLFNALVWCRFPSLKVAMNAVHVREIESELDGGRGKQRDALTLFDESGVIVCSSKEKHLQSLARHDWGGIFKTEAGAWVDEIRVFVVGHALLEKLLKPYKAITAHALLLCVDQAMQAQPRETLIPALDEWVAESLFTGQLLDSPSCLSPLPLMGIPGWWPGGEQADEFYADPYVFRPLRESVSKARVIDCMAASHNI
jgi:hypothetical protein